MFESLVMFWFRKKTTVLFLSKLLASSKSDAETGENKSLTKQGEKYIRVNFERFS